MEENKNPTTENANANAEAPKNDQAQQPQPEAPAAPAAKKPFYKKGWFWGVIGGIAAVGGVAAAFLLTKEDVAEAAETTTDAVAE